MDTASMPEFALGEKLCPGEFLVRLFAGAVGDIELRALVVGGEGGPQIFTRDRAALERFIAAHANKNLYFGCCTRRERQGDAAHCVQAVALWSDVDCKTISREETLRMMQGCPDPPSIIISSGGGLHAYWLLNEPLDAQQHRAEIVATMRGLTLTFEGDLASAEIARILRVPGTKNFKKEYKSPREVTIVSADFDLRYKFDHLHREWKEIPSPEPGQGNGGTPPTGEFLGIPIPRGVDLEAALLTKLNLKTRIVGDERWFDYHGLPGLQGGRQGCLIQGTLHNDQIKNPRQSGFVEKAGLFSHRCFDSDCRAFGQPPAQRGMERVEVMDLESKTRYAIRQLGLGEILLVSRNGTEPKPTVPPTDTEPGVRVPVIVHLDSLGVAMRQAEAALLPHAERIRVFQRGSELVQVDFLAKLQIGGGLKRPAGTYVLTPLATPQMQHIFEQVVAFKVKRPTKRPTPIGCPTRLAATYLLSKSTWELPLLEGVTSTPIMRLDGSILDSPGYDQRTGLFLISNENWLQVPENPTREDALAALEVLTAPFKEFPFVTNADRSVHIAGILTGIQRRILEACPLFNYSAPVQRTGKSKLAESVATIATGNPAAATSVSPEREELRKAITSALHEGQPIVNLDNVVGVLSSPDLARALTQRYYQDRLLGENKMVNLLTNTLWTATGTNLTVKGDLTSRSLLCQIDPHLERPEERSFAIPDLTAHLTTNRALLVAASLTILRAYHVAGKPRQTVKPWGGFDHWSREIREPLVWLGMADPCDTREGVAEVDPELEGTSVALLALYDVFQNRPFTVREAIAHANDLCTDVGAKSKQEALRTALLGVAPVQGKHADIDPRRLGDWLRRERGRVVSGLYLALYGEIRKVSRWIMMGILDSTGESG